MSKDCPNCPAFGKHCPHKVSGDPYFYDCYLTVADLEKEKAELKARVEKQNADILFLKHLTEELEKENTDLHKSYDDLYFSMRTLREENTELRELIKNIIRVTWGEGWNYSLDWKVKAEQFISEVEK